MTFEEWFKDNMIIDDSLSDAPLVSFYTKESVRAAWIAATLVFRETMTEYAREVDRRDNPHLLNMDCSKSILSTTIPSTPLCSHSKGWYNSFWGRRRVFICTDCGHILDENKGRVTVPSSVGEQLG